MTYVIKILKKELREWKQQYAGEKYYYKGEENHKWAKKSFRECKKRIAELEEAIEVLKFSSKVHSNLPISGQLKFCEDDLRKVWEAAKAGEMKGVPVLIDHYGGVNIQYHWHDKYQDFDAWYKQKFNCH